MRARARVRLGRLEARLAALEALAAAAPADPAVAARAARLLRLTCAEMDALILLHAGPHCEACRRAPRPDAADPPRPCERCAEYVERRTAEILGPLP